MAKRKQDKRHLQRLVDLGCCVCMREMDCYTMPEIHHTRFSCGIAQRSDDKLAIPLCFHHHSAQGFDGIHKGQRSWEEKHGTEEFLLNYTMELLNG
jgi:hypothetical protein